MYYKNLDFQIEKTKFKKISYSFFVLAYSKHSFKRVTCKRLTAFFTFLLEVF